MSFKIVFAGTPQFAAIALKALLNSEHQILAVYTQPDRPAGRGRELKPSPVKQLALENNVPVYQPLKLRDPKEQEILRNLNPDLLIVAAYGLILPQAVLDIPSHPSIGCINIHASLLPRWRGAAPIQHAILANDRETGITIMKMDAGLDTGDILSLHPCPILPTDTSEILHDKLAILGANALIETLKKLEKKEITPIKQDANLATYAAKIEKEHGQIDWEETAIALDCKIRAFNSWPVAFTRIHGESIRIWMAEPLPKIENYNYSAAGTILPSDKNEILVATGEGILRLLEIQLSGGKRLPVSEILKSKENLFKVGNRFE
jgi:methionyl-tRNA formyltransferase